MQRSIRHNRADLLERRCQELAEQLGAARQTQVQLRQEMFSSHPVQATHQTADSLFRQGFHNSSEEVNLFSASEQQPQEACRIDRSKFEARKWLGTAPRTEVHTLLSASAAQDMFPPIAIPSSISNSSSSCALPTSRLLSPVKEDPLRESKAGEITPPSPESRSAWKEEYRQEHQRPEPSQLRLDGEHPRMQKLLTMCERLKNEDESLLDAEADSLDDLVARLSQLMERHHDRPTRDTATRSAIEEQTNVIHGSPNAANVGTATPPIAGMRVADEDVRPFPESASALVARAFEAESEVLD